jgi:hypothetical protein
MNTDERISRLEAELAALKQRTGPSGFTVGPGLRLISSGNNVRIELVPVGATQASAAVALPALPPRAQWVLMVNNAKLEWVQTQEFACPL